MFIHYRYLGLHLKVEFRYLYKAETFGRGGGACLPAVAGFNGFHTSKQSLESGHEAIDSGDINGYSEWKIKKRSSFFLSREQSKRQESRRSLIQ